LGFALGRKAVHLIRVHDVEETRDFVNMFTVLSEQHSIGRPV